MKYATSESNRFKLNVYRDIIDQGDIEVDKIHNEIIDNSIDLLILRVNSNLKHLHHQLNKLPYQVLHCDNLVYYKCDLFKNDISDIANQLKFVSFTSEHKPILKTIVPEIFKDYQNHYFSNPLLDKKNIIDGYIEWVISNSLTERFNDKLWIVYNSTNQVVGFAKCNYNEYESICEGVLFGVLPTFSNMGIYTDLIRYSKKFFREKGIQTMIVSTQLNNYSVQRVWTKENFLISHSYDTYHINTLTKAINNF